MLTEMFLREPILYFELTDIRRGDLSESALLRAAAVARDGWPFVEVLGSALQRRGVESLHLAEAGGQLSAV